MKYFSIFLITFLPFLLNAQTSQEQKIEELQEKVKVLENEVQSNDNNFKAYTWITTGAISTSVIIAAFFGGFLSVQFFNRKIRITKNELKKEHDGTTKWLKDKMEHIHDSLRALFFSLHLTEETIPLNFMLLKDCLDETHQIILMKKDNGDEYNYYLKELETIFSSMNEVLQKFNFNMLKDKNGREIKNDLMELQEDFRRADYLDSNKKEDLEKIVDKFNDIYYNSNRN